MSVEVLIISAAAFVVSCVLTGVLRARAASGGLIDVPNERISHKVPTPRGGGAAIVIALTAALVAAPTLLAAQGVDSAMVAGMRWRSVGPAHFEGRIADITGIPFPSRTIFVAPVAGGVWKSTNGGVTFRPTFDDKPVSSMGALAVAPSDTMQGWAGTGEQNSRNSIGPGAGS